MSTEEKLSQSLEEQAINREIVRKNILEGPEEVRIRQKNMEEQSFALFMAVKHRDGEKVLAALEAGADRDCYENAPLRWAVEGGSVELTKMLLDHGAAVPNRRCDATGDSPVRNYTDWQPYAKTWKNSEELANILVDELGCKKVIPAARIEADAKIASEAELTERISNFRERTGPTPSPAPESGNPGQKNKV